MNRRLIGPGLLLLGTVALVSLGGCDAPSRAGPAVPVNPVPLMVTCWPTLAPDGVAELIDGTDAGAYGFAIGVSTPSPERVTASSFRSATPVLDGVSSTMARPCHASSMPSVRYQRT